MPYTRDIEGTPDQSCHPPYQLGGLVTLEDALVGGDEVRLPDDDVVEEEHVLGDEGEDGDEGDEEHNEHVHDLPPLAGRGDPAHPIQPLQHSTVQYSTATAAQYTTVQYSTVQYSTVQYSVVQLVKQLSQPQAFQAGFYEKASQ